jgi:hypothetical protein
LIEFCSALGRSCPVHEGDELLSPVRFHAFPLSIAVRLSLPRRNWWLCRQRITDISIRRRLAMGGTVACWRGH